MTLQKQPIGIPLKGLNTHADAKSAAPGEFELIENMVFKRTARGGAELRKRYGGAALAKTGAVGAEPAVTTGRKLSTFDSERLLLADDRLHSYSPQFAGWSNKGKISNVGVTLEHVSEVAALGQFTGGTGCAAPDVAISGNLMCVAWMDTATSHSGYWAVIDRNTGERLTSDTSVGTGMGSASWVRVIALASEFMLVFAKGATNQIVVETVQYSNLGGTGGTTVIVSDLNASCKGDVIRNGANDSVLVAYHTTAPSFKVLVINSNSTAGASATSAFNANQAIGWSHQDFSDGNAHYCWISSVSGAIRGFTPVGAVPALTEFTMDAAMTAAAQVTGFFNNISHTHFVEVRASPTYNTRIVWRNSFFGGAFATIARSVGIAARVFRIGIRYYLPCAYESPLQNTYFVMDTGTGGSSVSTDIVARSLYGLGGGLSLTANIPQPQVMANGTTALIPAMRLTMKLGTTPFYGVSIANLDFAGGGLSSPRRVGDNLHVPGGVVRAYAGEGATTDFLGELGFFLFPETPTLAQGAGGALTLLGTYQYVAVYAFTDGRGQIHRSAPSEIATFTLTGANQTIVVTVPTLRMSAKRGIFGATGANATVEVYATQASGTTFYRVAVQSGNDPSVDTVATNDTATDLVKGAGEVLYTSGKVLPHIAPPAAKLMESWRNRLFLAGTENPLELWPSNEYDPGNGVSFSDALVVTMEAEGGPITALAEMDDRLLIFKRGAIYALGGNGPTLTGGNPYEQPVRVCSHVGAISQAGVVKTRDGVMFKSPRGIYMYTRGGETVYVGAGVEAYNSLTVTGACVLEDEEQVRFTTSAGRTLVYCYGVRGDDGMGWWTTFTGQTAVDCIMWNGVFARLASDGTVTEETIGAYADPGAATIAAKARLCWLSLTQFFGRFKLYDISLLGDLLATFTLTHRIAYDYDATIAESETKAVTVATLPPLQLAPARRRATAVQVTLEETSTTQGFAVSSWGLEVGIEPGAKKSGLEKSLT